MHSYEKGMFANAFEYTMYYNLCDMSLRIRSELSEIEWTVEMS